MWEIATTDQEVGMKEIATGDRRPRLLKLSIAGLLAVVVAFGATAASAPARPQATVTITVNTLPIANALPLDLGIKKGFFAEQGIEINKRTLQSGNDVVLALAEQQRRDRLPRLGADVHRPHAGDRAHRGRRERGRGNVRGRQLAEHPRQGLELDPHPCRPGGQDGRRERAQGRRRGDDQGGAEEGRRRPGLGPPARAAVPGDALGAPERPGRRDLDPRAVPEPGARATAGGS